MIRVSANSTVVVAVEGAMEPVCAAEAGCAEAGADTMLSEGWMGGK